MAYVDYDYYTNTYLGTAMTETEFNPLAQRASDIIDMVTSYKIPMGKPLSIYPQFIQDCVMKATCAEVEYIFLKGGNNTLNGGGEGELKSVRLGNFNYQDSNPDANLTRVEAMLSPLVMEYLMPTGLLNKAVQLRSYADMRWGFYPWV